MVEIVNVVASGSLGVELDLNAIAQELPQMIDYDPDKYPGAYFRFDESRPLITPYRTGKYIITGAGSKEEADTTRSEFLQLLESHSILSIVEDEWYRVQNYVCMADIGRSLNLSALAIGLGLEVTEYEPEQFPGMVYRPPEHECVLLIFGSGKVVMTGAPAIIAAEDAFSDFRERLDELF